MSRNLLAILFSFHWLSAPLSAQNCATEIEDASMPSTCIEASSIPELGKLFPISQEFFVSSVGDIGIGTTTPLFRLDIADGAIPVNRDYGPDITGSFLRFYREGTERGRIGLDCEDRLALMAGASDQAALMIGNDRSVHMGRADDAVFAETPDFRYDHPIQKLLVRSILIANIGGEPQVALRRAGPDGVDPYTTMPPTPPQVGQNIAPVYWQPWGSNGSFDGTSGNGRIAEITARITGTPTGTSRPGELIFSTTAVNEATPTERMKILSDGTVCVSGDFEVGGCKNFVQPHPFDETKEIVYTCLEGPEAGTYCRGSAQVVKGIAVVELPDHFEMGTAGTISAQLTPVGQYLQLFVVERSARRIVVHEASGRDGSFDYFVQGERRGFGNRPVIRDKNR